MLTITALYYDIFRRQLEVRLVFQIVAEVLDAMTVEYEETVEGRLRAVDMYVNKVHKSLILAAYRLNMNMLPSMLVLTCECMHARQSPRTKQYQQKEPKHDAVPIAYQQDYLENLYRSKQALTRICRGRHTKSSLESRLCWDHGAGGP